MQQQQKAYLELKDAFKVEAILDLNSCLMLLSHEAFVCGHSKQIYIFSLDRSPTVIKTIDGTVSSLARISSSNRSTLILVGTEQGSIFIFTYFGQPISHHVNLHTKSLIHIYVGESSQLTHPEHSHLHIPDTRDESEKVWLVFEDGLVMAVESSHLLANSPLVALARWSIPYALQEAAVVPVDSARFSLFAFPKSYTDCTAIKLNARFDGEPAVPYALLGVKVASKLTSAVGSLARGLWKSSTSKVPAQPPLSSLRAER
jgi:hypothetical protein